MLTPFRSRRAPRVRDDAIAGSVGVVGWIGHVRWTADDGRYRHRRCGKASNGKPVARDVDAARHPRRPRSLDIAHAWCRWRAWRSRRTSADDEPQHAVRPSARWLAVAGAAAAPVGVAIPRPVRAANTRRYEAADDQSRPAEYGPACDCLAHPEPWARDSESADYSDAGQLRRPGSPCHGVPVMDHDELDLPWTRTGYGTGRVSDVSSC